MERFEKKNYKSQKENNNDYILQIPMEIILYIFSFILVCLTLKDIRITCKYFQNIIDRYRLIIHLNLFEKKQRKIEKLLIKYPHIEKININSESLQYIQNIAENITNLNVIKFKIKDSSDLDFMAFINLKILKLYIYNFDENKENKENRENITCKQFQSFLDKHRLIQYIDFDSIESKLNRDGKILDEEYYMKLLKEFPSVKKIQLHDNCNDSFLQYIPLNITSLVIPFYSDRITIDRFKCFLSTLSHLQYLVVPQIIADKTIPYLAKSLRSLHLYSCFSITDNGLSSLPQSIQILQIHNCKKITGEFIIHLPQTIKKLSIGCNNNVFFNTNFSFSITFLSIMFSPHLFLS